MKTGNTLLVVLLATATTSANPIIGLFPTGFGLNGLPVPIGHADPHYTLNGKAAIAATPTEAWIKISGAEWLCPTANGNTPVPAMPPYNYSTRFILPSNAVPDSVALTISLASDDGVTVLVNGINTQLPKEYGGFAGLNTFRIFGITSPFFFTGTNTLTFQVNNAPAGQTTPSPSGLLVAAMSGSFTTLPQTGVGSGDNYLTSALQKESKLDCDGAIADCNKAIGLKPNSAKAYFIRGEIHHLRDSLKYGMENDSDSAITDLSKAIELKPDYVEAYFERGGVKWNLKRDFKGAISDYNKAIEIKPDYANAYYGRGITKAENDDTDGAIADFTTSISLNPEASSFFQRAMLYDRKEDSDKAIADFTKYIELKPDASGFSQRAMLYYRKGNFDSAIADYTKVIELKPDNTYAKELLNKAKMARMNAERNLNH